MQISQNEDCLTLHQEPFIKTVIMKYTMQDGNRSKTSAENNLRLVKATDDQQLVDATLYISFVGSLLYIAKQSRPHIFG